MRTPSDFHNFAKRSITSIFPLLSLLMFCEPGRAGVVSGLCNTGWNGACTAELLTTGGPLDPNYFLIANPNGVPQAAIVVNTLTFPISPAGPWLADTSTSHWIGPVADQRFGFGCCVASLNPYIYRDMFSFSGVGSVTIWGRWAADNEASIFVNNIATGVILNGAGTSDFDSWHNFSITLSDTQLNLGNNNFIDFRVTNFSNATGLRVEYIPEPTSLASVGVGLLALGIVHRRRRTDVVHIFR